MKALVIEDNPSESELLTHALENAGYAVTATGLLEDAIATAAESRFDVITLDLRLRDSAPAATIARIPELDSASGGSPIVCVTGHASAIASLPPGLAGLVLKPYHTSEILTAVAVAEDSLPRPLKKKGGQTKWLVSR